MNKSLVISLVFLILVGIGVSRVKYEVVFLRKNLTNTQKEIEQCSDDLKVLRAEWSYLNNPKRLKILCEKHLKFMKPIESSQVISYDKIVGQSYEESFGGNSLDSFIDEALAGEKTGIAGQ